MVANNCVKHIQKIEPMEKSIAAVGVGFYAYIPKINRFDYLVQFFAPNSFTIVA